jgi:hypothetical protein
VGEGDDKDKKKSGCGCGAVRVEGLCPVPASERGLED